MEKKLKDIKDRIKRRIPHLTESQKRVANYIVEHPQKFSLSSIRELEQELKTSKSTIVRLAQSLGYDGFHELKSVFLESIRHGLTPIKRYKTFLSEPAKESNYLELIADETVHNIQDTLSLMDMEQYYKTVGLLKNAHHVYTMGVGISVYLADIAAYLLNRVSIRSNSMTCGGITFTEQIINLSQGEVILAFSFPPYSMRTIEAAHYAQEKGIKVITITDKATNTIVPYSDISLQVVVESISMANSLTAATVLLYSLTTQIGHELKDKTLETIRSIEYVRQGLSENNKRS